MSRNHPLPLAVLLLLACLTLATGTGCAAAGGESGQRPGPDKPVSDTSGPGTPDPGAPARHGTVRGVVLDAADRPVDGMFVQARSADEPPKPVPEIAVFSGPDGRYEWRLVPGRYELTASRDGMHGAPAMVTVVAGRTNPLDLRAP